MSRTVLLVEDEVLIADMIGRMLRRSPEIGPVLHARDMPEALEHLDSMHVDLVLLDINLSAEQSGLDLADHLNFNRPIPIIFLTSSNDRSTLAQIKSTGPVAYLNKPVNEATLLTTVELALATSGPAAEVPLTITIGTQQLRFGRSELLVARADHVYTDLLFADRKETVRMSLGKLLESVPAGLLVRINRSEAVNPVHIQKTSPTRVWLADGSVLKVSPAYWDGLK